MEQDSLQEDDSALKDASSSSKGACSQSEPENMQLTQSPIAKLMDRTNCGIVQQNGQRRYGPPKDWEGPPPPRGCEVFVGKIPRDCFEDELVPVFENVGKIYEMRLMMEYSGHNRGYAFVVYRSPAEAKESVKVLNNHEIRKGRTLGVCMSVDNCRLFVGGIPKKVVKEDIRTEMLKVTEGVVDVIVYPSASDKTKNRGFAFIEYESHRAAAMARRKLMSSRAQLWGHQVAVDWAEPELEVDVEVMAQVSLECTRSDHLLCLNMYIYIMRVGFVVDFHMCGLMYGVCGTPVLVTQGLGYMYMYVVITQALGMWSSHRPWVCGHHTGLGYVVITQALGMWSSHRPWVCGHHTGLGYVVITQALGIWSSHRPWVCGHHTGIGYVVITQALGMWSSHRHWVCGHHTGIGYVVITQALGMWSSHRHWVCGHHTGIGYVVITQALGMWSSHRHWVCGHHTGIGYVVITQALGMWSSHRHWVCGHHTGIGVCSHHTLGMWSSHIPGYVS